MNREELLSSEEYWLVRLQLPLAEALRNYMVSNRVCAKEMARRARVKKRDIINTLHIEGVLPLDKYVRIAIACNVAPVIQLPNLGCATSC